jgi:hypothetical protein
MVRKDSLVRVRQRAFGDRALTARSECCPRFAPVAPNLGGLCRLPAKRPGGRLADAFGRVSQPHPRWRRGEGDARP